MENFFNQLYYPSYYLKNPISNTLNKVCGKKKIIKILLYFYQIINIEPNYNLNSNNLINKLFDKIYKISNEIQTITF